MKKLTDDEMMAKALLCPESEKVPLEVGDRVIALETHIFCPGGPRVAKGETGCVTEVYPNLAIQGPLHVCVIWDGHRLSLYGYHQYIGKLVKRGSV